MRFNILNNYFNLHGLKVLDLFSGTGNISYEFASRGAGPITSIDGDMGCVNFIKKTALELDLDISVIKSDVLKFLEKSKSLTQYLLKNFFNFRYKKLIIKP